MSALRYLDVLARRVFERFFGPMYEWRFTRWLIARRGGNPDDYKGLGKWSLSSEDATRPTGDKA